MSKKTDFIFIIDKFNKFSIRALICAFENFFPDYSYSVVNFENIPQLKVKNSMIFCSFNSLNFNKYVNIISMFKQDRNILVCGGPHPSARPEKMAEFFDCVCVGEGEFVLKEIVESYLGGRLPKGIYKSNTKVNLDEFDTYPKKVMMFGAIEIMRGCQYRCSYCQTPALFPGKLRHRSIESILSNIRYSYKYEKKDYRFISPDAASYMYDKSINISAIYNLLTGIKKVTENKARIFFGSFPSEINPYFVTEDFVKILKEFCYNRRVVIGLQTASKIQLKKIKRSDEINKVENAIEIFLKYGFNVDVDFIFGLPFETEETLSETFAWISSWHKKVRIHSHYFMPLPGSKWENESPTPIPDKFIKEIKKYEGKGRIFGQFLTQLKIAQDIANKDNTCQICKI